MPVYPITTEITVNAPASKLFAFITTVQNFPDLHRATKAIVGPPEAIGNPATQGMRFEELVETPGFEDGFILKWEVRRLVKDAYFEMAFPLGWENGPLDQMIIIYNVIPLGPEKCRFIRDFVSFVKVGADTESTGVLKEVETHHEYLKHIKDRVEAL